MPELTDNNLKAEVKAFWNRASCDTWHAESQKFTREYFEQIEQWRYRDQPFIHSFAQFTRYHGKRVLEVGFGAGTDFIQWLRAGARASGVDLTEEALANLLAAIEKNEQRKREQTAKGLDALTYFVLLKLTDEGVPNPEAVSRKVREAFAKFSNWKRSEAELRELRKAVTFAIYAEEDSMEKVVATVESLFTLLLRERRG